MAALSETELQQRLEGAPRWRLSDAGEIERDQEFADFADAVAFVDRVAALAEQENHHPDILIHGWNKVRLTLSTHSEGGLTDSDFKLAARIDELLYNARTGVSFRRRRLLRLAGPSRDERRRRTSTK